MPISLEQHLAIATRDYAALSRFAVRRERFLDALINDDLASLWLYIDHLGRWSADAGPDAPGPDSTLRIARAPRDYTPH